MWTRLRSRFTNELRNVALCGHAMPEDGRGMVFEEEAEFQRSESGRFAICFACIEAQSIRCAWCGGAIAYGHGITLYRSRMDQRPRSDAMRYEDAFVGCLRIDCSIGVDFSGNWVEDEHRPGQGRVMNLEERFRQDAQEQMR